MIAFTSETEKGITLNYLILRARQSDDTVVFNRDALPQHRLLLECILLILRLFVYTSVIPHSYVNKECFSNKARIRRLRACATPSILRLSS